VLQKLFGLSHSDTTIRTETIAGLTTFLTMAYIIFVQCSVLGDTPKSPTGTGLSPDAVLIATLLFRGDHR